MAINCSHCGKELPQGRARFCNNCGSPVNAPGMNASQAQDGNEVVSRRPERTLKQQPEVAWPEPMTHVIAPDGSTPRIQQKNRQSAPFGDLPVTPLPQQPSIEELPTRNMQKEEMWQSAQAQWQAGQQVRPAQISSPMAQVQPARISNPMAQVGPVAMSGRQATPGTRRQPRVLVIAVIALVAVMLLGVAGWVVIARPFDVAPATLPLQSYQSTDLGMGVSYPTGWQQPVVDGGKKSIKFTDPNGAAQVVISVANGNSDLAQVLQDQAKQASIEKSTDGETVTLAGVQWKQVQGDVRQDGVNYTAHIYAAVYKNKVYTIKQIAPKGVYADYEKLTFARMRGTFRFLA